MPNVTTEETSRKSLSGFLHKYKWSALEPDIYQDIEPDNYFEFRDTKVPDNKQNHNNIKQNFSQTFERDKFYGRVINESGVLCVFVIIIYLIQFLF